MNNPRNIYDVLYTLVIVGVPVIATIVGIFLGKWLERKEKRHDRKISAYVNVEKVLSKWMNDVASLSENAFLKNADELTEAISLLVLIGSLKAIDALRDVKQAILSVQKEIREKKARREIDTSKGLEQFENWKKFVDARCGWLNLIREEIGTERKIKLMKFFNKIRTYTRGV